MLHSSFYKKIGLSLILFFAVLLTINNFVNIGFNRKIKLSFDIKGGSYFILQVNFEQYFNKKIEDTISLLKESFFDNNVKALPKLEGDNIFITYRRSSDLEFIKQRLDEKVYNIEELDNYRLSIVFTDKYIEKTKIDIIKNNINVLKKRVAEFGIKDFLVRTLDKDKILLQVGDISDPVRFKELLEKTALLTFHIVNTNPAESDETIKLRSADSLYELSVNKKILLTGDSIKSLNIAYRNGKPYISFKLDEYGKKKFAEITGDNIGKILAIVLDDKILTAYAISSKIENGIGMIAGNLFLEEMVQIISLLKSGSLMAPLSIVESGNITTPLGQNFIKSGIAAFVIGFILILVFILIFYKKSGLYFCIVLFLNLVLLIDLMSIFSITLTFYGLVAGFISTIVFAISGVLILEKEKIYGNDNLLSTMTFKTRTIFDIVAVLTIVAVVSYILFTGFAVVLLCGILSFITLICLKNILDFDKNKKLQL